MGIDPSRKGYHAYVVVDGKKGLQYENKVRTRERLLEAVKNAQTVAHKQGAILLIGIEQSESYLEDYLVENGVGHLYSLMALKVARYKKAWDVSDVKTDELDALANAYYLLDWQHKLKVHQAPSDLVKAARPIADELHVLGKMKTKLWERFWAKVDVASPELKELEFTYETHWFLETLIFMLGKCKQTGKKGFIAACRKRGAQKIDDSVLKDMHECLKKIEQVIPPKVLKWPARQILDLMKQIKYWRLEAGKVVGRWNDGLFLSTIQGMGAKTMIMLLKYVGDDWTRVNARMLSAYSGIAPIVQGSGIPDKVNRAMMKKKGIKPKELRRHHRIACNKDLKNALCLFALYSMKWHPWAKQAYRRFRDRNQTHWEALRNLAIKWVRIFVALIRDQVPYDPHVRQLKCAKISR